jgi:hypothetical protein
MYLPKIARPRDERASAYEILYLFEFSRHCHAFAFNKKPVNKKKSEIKSQL